MLAEAGLEVLALSPVIDSAPVGPSRRRYANAAAIVLSELAPERLLDVLQSVERRFGRSARGERWRARVLDLDIVLWSGGRWRSPRLAIPHPLFRHRSFVLAPAAAIAPLWRDPATGRTVRQLHARLLRPRPRATLDRARHPA
jgi:2-amino-4-hydroxy-6-hydroxymethyldihydropteridine diphosphokinase